MRGAKIELRRDDAAGQDDHLDAKRGAGADQAAELLQAGIDGLAVDHHLDGGLVEPMIGGADLRAQDRLRSRSSKSATKHCGPMVTRSSMMAFLISVANPIRVPLPMRAGPRTMARLPIRQSLPISSGPWR